MAPPAQESATAALVSWVQDFRTRNKGRQPSKAEFPPDIVRLFMSFKREAASAPACQRDTAQTQTSWCSGGDTPSTLLPDRLVSPRCSESSTDAGSCVYASPPRQARELHHSGVFRNVKSLACKQSSSGPSAGGAASAQHRRLRACDAKGANPFVRQPPPHRARVQPGARENRAPNAGPNLPEAPGAGARSDTQAAGGAVQAVQRSPGRAWHDGSGTSPLSPLLVRQGCAARVPAALALRMPLSPREPAVPPSAVPPEPLGGAAAVAQEPACASRANAATAAAGGRTVEATRQGSAAGVAAGAPRRRDPRACTPAAGHCPGTAQDAASGKAAGEVGGGPSTVPIRAAAAAAAVVERPDQASGSHAASDSEASESGASGSDVSGEEGDAAPERTQPRRAANRVRGGAATGGARRAAARQEAAKRETLEASGSGAPGCEASGDEDTLPAHKKQRRAASRGEGEAAAGGARGRAARPKAAKRQNFVRMSRKNGKGGGSRFQSKAGASNKYRQARSRGRLRRERSGGGGRGGGASDGSSRRNVCFACGAEGHWARECTARVDLAAEATAAAADGTEPGPAPALVWYGAQWPGARET